MDPIMKAIRMLNVVHAALLLESKHPCDMSDRAARVVSLAAHHLAYPDDLKGYYSVVDLQSHLTE